MSSASLSEDDSSESALYAFTSDDHSALVMIVTIVASLCMLTVVGAKVSLHRKIPSRNLFDFILLAGVLPLVSQTVLMAYAARLGLGKDWDEVDAVTTDRILQVRGPLFDLRLHGQAVLGGSFADKDSPPV